MAGQATANTKAATTSSQPTAGLMYAILAFVAAAVAGFGVLFSIWLRTGTPDAYETLRIATREFVAENRILAGTIAQQSVLDPESEADLPWRQLQKFLIAASQVAEADQTDDVRELRVKLHAAIPLLREAAELGFPKGREGEGQRLLGMSLFRTGQFAEAADALRRAIDDDPTLSRQLFPTVAMAELRSPRHPVNASYNTISTYLEDPSLEPGQRYAAEAILVRALLELKRWDEAKQLCKKILATFDNDPTRLLGNEDHREQTRLFLAITEIRRLIDQYGVRPIADSPPASKLEEIFYPTMELLSEIELEASPAVAAQSRLWAARAHLCQGDVNAALTQLTAVRQQRPFGAEAVLAGLEEIELLSEQGSGIDVLQTARYMIREIGTKESFDPTLVSFDDFRLRMGNSVERLRRAGKYREAIDVARSLPPLFDAREALILEADSYREWASSLVGPGISPAKGSEQGIASVARGYYRSAGDAYSAAAQLDFDSERYVPTLWSAIDAYQNGRHYTRSIELLEPYLRYEDRSRLPRGMVAYGRALLAEGQPQRAIDTLNDCVIEFPRDPLRYDARLLAAVGKSELGDVAAATELLNQNLQDGELTPQSPAWRDSLFMLGEILFSAASAADLKASTSRPEERITILRDNQPQIQQAIRVLDEAVERYWPSERSQFAAFNRGNAHVLASTWPRVESESPEVLDAARRSLRAQSDVELERARTDFSLLADYLAKREEEVELSASEQQLLRNSLIAEADTLRKMKRYEEAVEAYRAVSIRYMNKPPALEAMLGQYYCTRALGKTREAIGVLRQAAIILDRVPPEYDEQFATATRHDRAGWKAFLDWMTGLLDVEKSGA